jgi:hypothetical protein
VNKYDELYIFREATINDVDKLMHFIKEHWRANHILGNDRDFFLYEHGNGDNINFVICQDRKSGEIVGMQGYIPYSREEERRHICGVMTMVKKGITTPLLGVELMKRFIDIINHKTYFGIGTNPQTMVPLVKRLFGRFVFKSTHYYRLNEKVDSFKVAKIVDRKKSSETIVENSAAQLVEFSSFEEVKRNFALNKAYKFLPYKEDWYIKKRYFDHPIYRYRVWGIPVKGTILALLFGREVECADRKILRFVDFIGNIEDLVHASKGVKDIIEADSFEYADFLLHGIPERIMNKSGFVRKDEEDGNIIPNYFEPFVQNNVDIWLETSQEDMVVFKGDSDQDRPNFR